MGVGLHIGHYIKKPQFIYMLIAWDLTANNKLMENNFGVILYSNGNTQFSNSYFASTIAERQFMGNCGKIFSAK